MRKKIIRVVALAFALLSSLQNHAFKGRDQLLTAKGVHPEKIKDKNLLSELESLKEKEILMVLRNKNGKECYSKFLIVIDGNKYWAIDVQRRVEPGKYTIVATSYNKIYGRKIDVKYE